MKSILMAILLILVNFNLCYGQDNERSSNFIYSIPVIEGMEPYGRVEEEILNISDFIEYAFIAKVFQSKEGRIISAEDICKFYHDHFVSLKFRPWQDASSLSGRYLAPSIVTKGNAHIRSQGHISYWIPREGNSVTFFIQQRRDFDIRQSQPVLDTIIAAFENASGEFNYKTKVLSDKTIISDWPVYLENECYVDRVVINISYGEKDSVSQSSIGDNKSYIFYCSVFPTFEHARQWRDKIIEEHDRIKRWPDWFTEGVGMAPVVVENIVVEYKGEAKDKDNLEFKTKLLEELNKIKTTILD